MRAAICGGKTEETAQLRTLLAQLSRELCLPLTTEIFPACAPLLTDHEPGKYGVVLLDGDLPDCVETGRKLRQLDRDCGVILFAGDSRAALLGYAVHPDGFVKKPVTCRGLRGAMDRCRQFWRQHTLSLTVTVNRVEVTVNCGDIAWIEVNGRNVTIFGRYGRLETRMTLAQVEEQLQGAPFLKCHRSFLVNPFRVRSCGREVLVMTDGAAIPISEDRWGEVQESWQRFCRENPLCGGDGGESLPVS